MSMADEPFPAKKSRGVKKDAAGLAGISMTGAVSTRPEQPIGEAEGVTGEAGKTGLRRSGGIIIEEFLPSLRGQRGYKVYQEMATEPIIGGVILALTEIIGRLDWKIVPPDDPTPDETGQATFVQENLDDMSDGWDVTLSQIMSMIPFGWSFFETVYKYRNGAGGDGSQSSRFKDGRIGWRKFAIRGQDTLQRWVFDDNGGLRGMIQYDQFGGGGQIAIPIERALLFRTEEYKGNPEGKSLLRGAYRAWYFKKRIEEIEAVGIERDFAGMPKVFGPAEWFDTPGNANLEMLHDMVRKAKRNELDGIVLPSIFDTQNNRVLDFTLMSSGGARQFDTNAVIGRYNNAIATSVLMDFLTLGHEGTGSYSLGAAKISMWQLVVDSIAKSIASVINRHAIPRLMLINGWAPDRTPQLVYGDVAQADLSVLGDFLSKMIAAGVIIPDAVLESYVRDLLNLPEANDVDGPMVDLHDTGVAATEVDTGADPTPAPAAEQTPMGPGAVATKTEPTSAPSA